MEKMRRKKLFSEGVESAATDNREEETNEERELQMLS